MPSLSQAVTSEPVATVPILITMLAIAVAAWSLLS